MAGRVCLAGSGEVTREGARLPDSSAVPDRAGQLPLQTTSLGSSVGPPSFVKGERSWRNSPQHPSKANSQALPCWVVGQEGPKSCEDRSGKPVLIGPAGQRFVSPSNPPQREQEQTMAMGDSPVSHLPIPTPLACLGQPILSFKGAGDQPFWPSASSLLTQPCSPLCARQQGPWRKGFDHS